MPEWLDTSLYPDVAPPESLESLGDRVDFLARLCSAWDFGILPTEATIDEVRGAGWREAVEACRLFTSAAYHLLRRWHGLPQAPYLGPRFRYIQDDPNLRFI